MASRVRRTLKRVKEILRIRMHDNVHVVGQWLGQMLRGWLGYYAVPTSYRSLCQFVHRLRRLWLGVIRRRSQKDRSSWEWLDGIIQKYWPPATILHPGPVQQFSVKHSR